MNYELHMVTAVELVPFKCELSCRDNMTALQEAVRIAPQFVKCDGFRGLDVWRVDGENPQGVFIGRVLLDAPVARVSDPMGA